MEGKVAATWEVAATTAWAGVLRALGAVTMGQATGVRGCLEVKVVPARHRKWSTESSCLGWTH